MIFCNVLVCRCRNLSYYTYSLSMLKFLCAFAQIDAIASYPFGLASKEKNFVMYWIGLDDFNNWDIMNVFYVNIVFLIVYSSSGSDFSLYLSSRSSTICSNNIRKSLLCSITSTVKQLSNLFSKQ